MQVYNKKKQATVDQTPSWLRPTSTVQTAKPTTSTRYDPTARPATTTSAPAKTQETTTTTKPKSSGGGSYSSSTPTVKSVTVTPVDNSVYAYDPSTNAAYTNAMAALEKAKGELPQYAGTYDGQLDALYQQIVGRDKFSYDLNEDMFYQQAVDQYTKLGNMAMMDTMGQAAALTGGYGNTYAQNAGQQAYQGYLQQLHDNIPQYYQMALDAYNAQGDEMMQQYGLLGDLADREYGQYQDDLANYWQNVGYLQDVADTEYSRGYENWYNAERKKASEQGQNFDRLVTMMGTMGYQPTAEEFAAAGLNTAQANAFLNYYGNLNKKSSGGGSGRNTEPTVTYDDLMSLATQNIQNGSMQYTDVYKTFEAAAKEGVITEDQRKAAMKDIYQVVKNR